MKNGQPIPPFNPKDPLGKVAPANDRELWERFLRVSNGQFSGEAILNASASMIVTVIRESCASREPALRAFDELFGRAKQVLADHYDVLGRKRGVFPYDQHLIINETFDPDKHRKR